VTTALKKFDDPAESTKKFAAAPDTTAGSSAISPIVSASSAVWTTLRTLTPPYEPLRRHRTETAPSAPGAPKVPTRQSAVFLHGFTQTGAHWDPFLDVLAQELALTSRSETWDCLTPDLAGHGRTIHPHKDLWESASAVACAAPDNPIYIGYSMGGRTALHVALHAPQRVRALVLIGATAGLRTESERAQRREADDTLARTLERDGIEPFIDQWLSNPLFATLPVTARDRSLRLRNAIEGLATSLRRCGTGSQDDLWPRLRELSFPVLLLSGDRDDKFTRIAANMREEIGTNATHATVASSGHACHGEQPRSVAQLILEFAQSLRAGKPN
jgi:2-succinyl-6-hydroxy-2,4-cyclohexadiene-1-carboxylate synthase